MKKQFQSTTRYDLRDNMDLNNLFPGMNFTMFEEQYLTVMLNKISELTNKIQFLENRIENLERHID